MERVLALVTAAQVFLPVLAATCPGGMECVLQDKCKSFQDLKTAWRGAPGGEEKDDMFAELKGRICNRANRQVCCEPPLTGGSTKLPRKEKFECGVQPDLAPGFILGGDDTLLAEFPWTVLMGKPNKARNGTRWYCGGTLLNEWWVVTAAHCTKGMTKVRVGEWQVQDDRIQNCLTRRGAGTCHDEGYDCLCGNDYGREFPRLKGKRSCGRGVKNVCIDPHQDIIVDKVIRKPTYGALPSGIVVDDIALVKLSEPAILGEYVTPICLPDKAVLERYGEPGTERLLSHGKPVVVGWGKTYNESDKEVSSVSQAKQQKVELPVVSIAQCGEIYSQLFSFNLRGDIRMEEHLCAGGELGKDSCKGDSGGPLVGRESSSQPWELVGVVSAGTKVCGRGAPGIFTRVTSYVEWIRDTVGKE